MALTITKEQLHRIPTGNGAGLILGVFLVGFDSSYPTGGEEADLSGFMKQVIDMKVQSTEDSPGYVFDVDDTNFATAKPTIEVNQLEVEAGGTAGADTYIVKKTNVLAVAGAGTLFQQKLKEVTNGTDLSAVKARCVVWGLG